jgi:hypothetical protein
VRTVNVIPGVTKFKAKISGCRSKIYRATRRSLVTSTLPIQSQHNAPYHRGYSCPVKIDSIVVDSTRWVDLIAVGSGRLQIYSILFSSAFLHLLRRVGASFTRNEKKNIVCLLCWKNTKFSLMLWTTSIPAIHPVAFASALPAVGLLGRVYLLLPTIGTLKTVTANSSEHH